MTPADVAEWLKNAYAQAEEWHTSAVTAARQRVLTAYEAHQKSLDELDDIVKKRTEMRESFAKYYADSDAPRVRNDADQESGHGDVHGADGWWGGS